MGVNGGYGDRIVAVAVRLKISVVANDICDIEPEKSPAQIAISHPNPSSDADWIMALPRLSRASTRGIRPDSCGSRSPSGFSREARAVAGRDRRVRAGPPSPKD